MGCLVRLCLRVRAARKYGVEENDLLDDDEEDEAKTAKPQLARAATRTHNYSALATQSFFATPSFLDFKQRTVHAMLILLSIFVSEARISWKCVRIAARSAGVD